MVIDAVIPPYVRLHNKETEKAKKHQGFKRERETERERERERLVEPAEWEEVQVTSVVIGVLGSVSKKRLEN